MVNSECMWRGDRSHEGFQKISPLGDIPKYYPILEKVPLEETPTECSSVLKSKAESWH